MKIRYKISGLMIILAVAIILLINLAYVTIITRATDDFITRYMPHQITATFLDLPSEKDIDWSDMQAKLDDALGESDDLVYIAVYGSATEPRIISIDMERVQPLLQSNENLQTPREIISALNMGTVTMKVRK